jgi:hypothetical protein
MRLSAIPYYSCLLFFCSLHTSIRAQPAGKDSLITTGAYYNALQVYHRYLTPETGLYRGSEYVQYAYTLKEGHPYFDDGRMKKGSVLYNGILYEDLPLLYDLVKEQVVLNDSYDNYTIFLINEQIDYFTIQDHLFINFRDSLNPSAPHRGFYEQLNKDRIALYKKEKKVVQEDISSGKLERNIEPSVSYYLKKGPTWYSVNNKRSLLYALDDRRREVKKFIRKNGLNVRKNKENTLLKVTAWYNSEISTTANK